MNDDVRYLKRVDQPNPSAESNPVSMRQVIRQLQEERHEARAEIATLREQVATSRQELRHMQNAVSERQEARLEAVMLRDQLQATTRELLALRGMQEQLEDQLQRAHEDRRTSRIRLEEADKRLAAMERKIRDYREASQYALRFDAILTSIRALCGQQHANLANNIADLLAEQVLSVLSARQVAIQRDMEALLTSHLNGLRGSKRCSCEFDSFDRAEHIIVNNLPMALSYGLHALQSPSVEE